MSGDVYIPQVGDRIYYMETGGRLGGPLIPWENAEVTKVERFSGYTEIWLNGASEDNEALFNINHTTGKPNTQFSRGGSWTLRKRADMTSTHPDLVDLDGETWKWNVLQGTYRLRGRSGTREYIETAFGGKPVVPEPRVFFPTPTVSPDVTRVESVAIPYAVFHKGTDGTWVRSGSSRDGRTWEELLSNYPSGLREVPESEYDAALRRLKETSLPQLAYDLDQRNYDALLTLVKPLLGD